MTDKWTKERWDAMLSRPYSRTVNRDMLNKNNEKQDSYPIRLKLFNTYKDKLNEAWIELDEEGEETFYKSAKNVLQDFINECKTIIKTNDLEITCEFNNRQIGGYKRCIIDYPDKGWNTEREQIGQAYTELIVDFLYYNSSDIEYKELTVKEIVTMVEMAEFLIEKVDEIIEIIE